VINMGATGLYVLGTVFFIAILLFLFSDFIELPNQTEIPIDMQGNVMFYVSNQNPDVSPVDIKVLINNKTAVDEDFYYSKSFPTFSKPGHVWEKYKFKIEPGNHTIKILSPKGELERKIEITANHWIVIAFSENGFEFSIDSSPIYVY